MTRQPVPGDDARAPLRPAPLAAGILLALLALAGCGAEDPDDAAARGAAGPDTTAPATAPSASADGIDAVDPWVRVAVVPEPPPEGGPPVNSAAYVVLRNTTGEDDALVAVGAALSDTVELHTVSMADGIMRMRPVEAVPVPAGGEAVLEPGGFHIMLIGLHAPLVEGDTADLTLRFRSGRTLRLSAPVRRAPSCGPER